MLPIHTPCRHHAARLPAAYTVTICRQPNCTCPDAAKVWGRRLARIVWREAHAAIVL